MLGNFNKFSFIKNILNKIVIKFNSCKYIRSNKKENSDINPTGRIINYLECNSWGNNIEILNWEQNSFCCWMTPRIKIGDEVRFKMESGKTMGFLVKSLVDCIDPKDMSFFSICTEPVYVDGYKVVKNK